MNISHIRSFHQKDNCILLMAKFLGCLTGSTLETTAVSKLTVFPQNLFVSFLGFILAS